MVTAILVSFCYKEFKMEEYLDLQNEKRLTFGICREIP